MSGELPQLWPTPVLGTRRGGSLPVPGPVYLQVGAGAREWADDLLERLAWLRVRPGSGESGAVTVWVEHDPGLAVEEFVLDVDQQEGVRISAGSVLGAGHATVTLRQLLPADAHRITAVDRASWVLPEVHIQDRPALGWRGFMLDVARHFTPKDELLRIIDAMSLHRLNRLHLHLTDDQGWRFETPSFPRIAEVATWRTETPISVVLDGGPQPGDGTPHGGFYTVADLREITAHARSRGVVIVPEVDLPGHASALLAAVPSLRVPGTPEPAVGTAFGPGARAVNPLPAGREAIARILADLAAAVDSPYLHLGGDEASLADWESSAAVHDFMADNGLDSIAALRSDLSAHLVGQVEELGRRAVVWDEAFTAGGLPPATVVMAWRAESPGLAAMAAGHDVVMTPMEYTYLDYADTWADGVALGYGQTVARVAGYTPSVGEGPGELLGVQAALWTEYVPDARYRAARMFPRLSVHAANAWTGTSTDWPAARPAMEVHLQRLAAAGIEYRPLDGPLPWQRGGTGRRAATSPLTTELLHDVSNALLNSAEPPQMAEFGQILDDLTGQDRPGSLPG